MQTITFKDSNISAYIFEDNPTIIVTAENITCPNFIIGDLNSSNAVVYTGVTPPEDWVGSKYLFDGTTWTENPDYVEPEEIE